MKRRSLYLDAGLLGTTFASFYGGQSVFANPPKAIVKSYDINRPDVQNELVDHCYSNIEQYWLKRFSYDGSKNFSAFELEWLLKFFGQSSDVDVLLNKLIQEKRWTLPKLNKKFREYYDLAMKDTKKSVDCRVVSSHVLSFLRSKDIKSYIMSFNTTETEAHDVVIYAVSEKGKENWYVCDMEQARGKALQIFLQRGTKTGLLNKFEIIELFRMPLVDYVKNYVVDFNCFVLDDTVGKDIIGEKGYTDEYWLLGEFVKQNCNEEYQKKFLADKLTKDEALLLDRSITNISSLKLLPFRLYERQKGFSEYLGTFYNNEKNGLTFLPEQKMYGRLYSLRDESRKKNYENAIFMPQCSLQG